MSRVTGRLPHSPRAALSGTSVRARSLTTLGASGPYSNREVIVSSPCLGLAYLGARHVAALLRAGAIFLFTGRRANPPRYVPAACVCHPSPLACRQVGHRARVVLSSASNLHVSCTSLCRSPLTMGDFADVQDLLELADVHS